MHVSTTVWTRITGTARGGMSFGGGGCHGPVSTTCSGGCAGCDGGPSRIAAPGCRPARLRRELDALLWDDTPVPAPARAVAAARVFSEGNCYLPGQIVDRSA